MTQLKEIEKEKSTFILGRWWKAMSRFDWLKEIELYF